MAKETSQKVVTWKTYRRMKDNIKASLRKITVWLGSRSFMTKGSAEYPSSVTRE